MLSAINLIRTNYVPSLPGDTKRDLYEVYCRCFDADPFRDENHHLGETICHSGQSPAPLLNNILLVYQSAT